MRRIITVAGVALAQLALVGVGVAPQLSARVTGDSYLLRVAPIDPIDPFRGAYVSLSYPDLRTPGTGDAWDPDSWGGIDTRESGDMYIVLRRDGDVWVASDWSRERPDADPYLACSTGGWQARCGIDSWFLPQDEAAAMEKLLGDGAIAEVRIDGRGNAALVDVRETP